MAATREARSEEDFMVGCLLVGYDNDFMCCTEGETATQLHSRERENTSEF